MLIKVLKKSITAIIHFPIANHAGNSAITADSLSNSIYDLKCNSPAKTIISFGVKTNFKYLDIGSAML